MDLENYFKKGINIEDFEDILDYDKKIHELHYRKFNPDTKKISRIKNLEEMKIIVITEPWCGDSLAILPVFKKIGEINGKWYIKIILRDENTELIDKFLTKGGRAIPVVLFMKKDFSLISKWGPRPGSAQKIFEDHREGIRNGKIEKSVVSLKIRKFYAVDRGEEILNTILKVLENNKQPMEEIK